MGDLQRQRVRTMEDADPQKKQGSYREILFHKGKKYYQFPERLHSQTELMPSFTDDTQSGGMTNDLRKKWPLGWWKSDLHEVEGMTSWDYKERTEVGCECSDEAGGTEIERKDRGLEGKKGKQRDGKEGEGKTRKGRERKEKEREEKGKD
jgi:hypothetical protein